MSAGWLEPAERIEIGGYVFFPGQPVVTRANDRALSYGRDGGEWVRNGDRWTVNAGTRDELYLTNVDNGQPHAITSDYIAAGNLTVNYASTINRAQGTTVDEAHLIVDERTNAKQLYVGTTRGRNANHVHAAPPAFDPDQHGAVESDVGWTPVDAVAAAAQRQSGDLGAIARRRELRELSNQTRDLDRGSAASDLPSGAGATDAASERAAAAMRRLKQLTRRSSTWGLER